MEEDLELDHQLSTHFLHRKYLKKKLLEKMRNPHSYYSSRKNIWQLSNTILWQIMTTIEKRPTHIQAPDVTVGTT